MCGGQILIKINDIFIGKNTMYLRPPIKNILTAIICILLFLHPGFAQIHFTGFIYNKETQSPIPDAFIRIDEIGAMITSDSAGFFSFYGNEETELHTLDIYSLGCHRNTEAVFHSGNIDTITLLCAPVDLEAVQVNYYDPKVIVRKAVEKISENYPDSNFAVPAFYRQYQQVNGKYQNLIESGSTVLFRVEATRTGKIAALSADEAFGVNAIRTSKWHFNISDLHDDDYVDLMEQNPVYHLNKSSFTNEMIDAGHFVISPASNDSVWVISYSIKNVSSENHGIQNFNELNLYGEADETGILIIDKATSAFITIERRAVRNDGYDYPKYNNFLQPGMEYTIGFKNAYLLIDFERQGERWYPLRILHSYTNDFFTTATNTRAYVISDYYEWYAGNPYWVLDPATFSQLEKYSTIFKTGAEYNATDWEVTLPGFYFEQANKVISDLESDGPLLQQFSGSK